MVILNLVKLIMKTNHHHDKVMTWFRVLWLAATHFIWQQRSSGIWRLPLSSALSLITEGVLNRPKQQSVCNFLSMLTNIWTSFLGNIPFLSVTVTDYLKLCVEQHSLTFPPRQNPAKIKDLYSLPPLKLHNICLYSSKGIENISFIRCNGVALGKQNWVDRSLWVQEQTSLHSAF